MVNRAVPTVNPEEQARQAFSNHVQSVAFQISLSRAMIEQLQIIRDFGYPRQYPHAGERGLDPDRYQTIEKAHMKLEQAHPRLVRHFMTHRPALERRGLVYSVHDVPIGDRTWFLTRAGILMCELLVEAGLLAPAKARRKRA